MEEPSTKMIPEGDPRAVFWWLMAYFLRIIPWLGYVGKPTMMSFRPLSRISDYSYTWLGFPKWWYPQIIQFNRDFHYKPSKLGCFPIFGNIHMAWFRKPLHTDTPLLQVAVLDAHPPPEASWTHPKDQFHGCLFLRRITTTFDRWIRHLDLGIHGDWGVGCLRGGWEKTLTTMWATKNDNPSEFVFYFLIRGF